MPYIREKHALFVNLCKSSQSAAGTDLPMQNSELTGMMS